MAQSVKPGSQAKSNVFLLVGVVAILGGIALVVYGFAPAKPLMETISNAVSGGTAPPDLGERMDAAIAELKARAWADGLGFLAVLVGFVLVKSAFAKPKPKSVERLVQEEVERRFAAVPSVAVQPSLAEIRVSPSPAPAPTPFHTGGLAQVTVQQAAARQPPAMADRRTHCATCSSVLVAGGRICPRGHPQA